MLPAGTSSHLDKAMHEDQAVSVKHEFTEYEKACVAFMEITKLPGQTDVAISATSLMQVRLRTICPLVSL